MDVEVIRSDQDGRFEARLDDRVVGSAFFAVRGDAMVFTHTEVDDALEGHGIGSRLARAALDDARAHGLRVVPQCPFIARWIELHPEYAALVA